MTGGEGGAGAGAPEGTPEYLVRDTVALLTPIANGKVLAAICALNGCRCDVIEFRQGTLAVMVDDREGLADFAAARVGAFAKDAIILAMERRDGQLSVVPWTGGLRGEELPPGLALDRAPEAVVALMSGAMTIETLLEHAPGRVLSGRTGRWRAFWALRRLARQGRREQRA
ncbi:MAG: hypothetical protein JW722_01015 [Demequinaceae bacterium]|nr:hypothetical protein [Demequinaceae bacterium]